ncbi:MAG TPA: hypothetical protein VM791_15095, partial [Vicinamibacterales bacterium]|nr:hypothetical protein [Vicinamibacterales bacterium]
MHVFRLRVTLPLFALVLVSGLSVAGQSSAGRALRIEDYYRIRNVGSPTISPNGQWVAFAVTTRVDDDKDANKSASEGWYVPIDGRVPPARLEPSGGDVTNLRWLDDNRLQYSRDQQQWTIDPSKPSESAVRVESPERGGRGGRGGGRGRGAATATPSPDGRWRAELRDKPQTKNEPQYASDFEKRHQQRFEGAIFDWKDFQRDGQPFPVPDPRARPAV